MMISTNVSCVCLLAIILLLSYLFAGYFGAMLQLIKIITIYCLFISSYHLLLTDLMQPLRNSWHIYITHNDNSPIIYSYIFFMS